MYEYIDLPRFSTYKTVFADYLHKIMIDVH